MDGWNLVLSDWSIGLFRFRKSGNHETVFLSFGGDQKLIGTITYSKDMSRWLVVFAWDCERAPIEVPTENEARKILCRNFLSKVEHSTSKVAEMFDCKAGVVRIRWPE